MLFLSWFRDKALRNNRILYLFWFALIYLIYGLTLHNFAFYSDDFGYFLNFRNQAQNQNSLSSALISYLTGGVPRLQLGWHITHQLLFQIFTTNEALYYYVQVVLLFLNSLLLYHFLSPYVSKLTAFLAVTLVIVNPFFVESFYWVSANYGFFQIFFLMVSFLSLRKALYSEKTLASYAWLVFASLNMVLCALYQEQSFPFIFSGSLIMFCFTYGKVEFKKSIQRLSFFTLFNLLFLFLIFLPQVLLISGSSNTSLIDTFKVYYPEPISSSVQNIVTIMKQTLVGEFEVYRKLSHSISQMKSSNHWAEILSQFKYGLLLLIFFGFIVMALYFERLKIKSSREKNTKIFQYFLMGIILWFISASVVVMPIKYFMGRYIYFILPPATLLLSMLLTRLFLLWPLYAIPIGTLLVIANLLSTVSFLHHDYFPLIRLEKKIAPQVISEIQNDPKIKAIVFHGFPATHYNATSGVFLNYHATEWWLRWRSLPNDVGILTVGNEATPCFTKEGLAGFKLIYGDYPLERLQTCFSFEQVLFAELKGEIQDSDSLGVKLYRKKAIEWNQTFNTDINLKDSLTIQLPEDYFLNNCEVNVTVEAENVTGILDVRLHSLGTTMALERVNAKSSGLGYNEVVQLIAKERVSAVGPYSLKLSIANSMGGEYTPTELKATIKNVHLVACGKSLASNIFYENHNPDPNNPYLRWISPAANFSVVMSYANSAIWENYFGIGINDAANTGDYYCFPDDEVRINESNSTITQKAYLGMLYWNRILSLTPDQIKVEFVRKHTDGLAERGKLDIMSMSEFNSYDKQKLPLDMSVVHWFKATEPYSKVEVFLKSVANNPITVNWKFQDSSVFDFRIGTDYGVESILSSGLGYNHQLISLNPAVFPIIFRDRSPRKENMAVFEWTCSNGYISTFLSDGSTEFNKNLVYSDVIQKGKYAKNSFSPHRNHGISFSLELAPGQEKSFYYYKVFLSKWETQRELLLMANQMSQKLLEKECHGI